MTLRHIILSLAAVFLALAGGVVLGARVLSDPIVVGLRGEKGDLQHRVGALQADKDSLDRRLSAADDFDGRMSGRIVADALKGRSVVVIRTPDAVDADVSSLTDLVNGAAGSVTGTISLTKEFVGSDSGEKLRSVVNSPIVPAGTALDTTLTDPSAQAGDLLGIAVLVNRDPKAVPVDDAARETVLSALRDTGFLTFTDNVRAADAAVIVTGGALPNDAGNQGAAAARFAAALAQHGSATVLAGRDGSAEEVAAVAVTRADAGLARLVTTVDDVDIEAGRITTVLALQAMLGGAPAESYGVGPGAVAVTVGR